MGSESNAIHIPALPERVTHPVSSRLICELASICGFQLAGVVNAVSHPDYPRFQDWTARGCAGEMRYLTDRRAQVRSSIENLLPGAKSVICVGLVYNGPQPYSTEFNDIDRGWISRYAWGEDYHDLLRERLEALALRLAEHAEFRWRACVDTAPLLERSYANQAGLGWIGKNTCLINEGLGSWFFLGELLTTLEVSDAPESPPPDRCGTCTRCIDACPTAAIVPSPAGGFELDARLCISYFTIELRGVIPEEHRTGMGHHIFGCDICQDVCPWNSPRRAATTEERGFEPKTWTPSLDRMAALTEAEFRALFRDSPVSRAKYAGFLRNVAVAMGNAAQPAFAAPLQRLAESGDELVAEHARWALAKCSCNS